MGNRWQGVAEGGGNPIAVDSRWDWVTNNKAYSVYSAAFPWWSHFTSSGAIEVLNQDGSAQIIASGISQQQWTLANVVSLLTSADTYQFFGPQGTLMMGRWAGRLADFVDADLGDLNQIPAIRELRPRQYGGREDEVLASSIVSRDHYDQPSRLVLSMVTDSRGRVTSRTFPLFVTGGRAVLREVSFAYPTCEGVAESCAPGVMYRLQDRPRGLSLQIAREAGQNDYNFPEGTVIKRGLLLSYDLRGGSTAEEAQRCGDWIFNAEPVQYRPCPEDFADWADRFPETAPVVKAKALSR
jgi:hypothetical protein